MINDMTQGKPFKVLLKFTLPMLLSLVFQQLYNVVDSIVAGKAIGVNALAAVGASFPITMLFIAIASGGSVGCSVVISQLFGSKSYGQMKTSISTTLISLAATSVVLTVIGMLVCNPLLTLMNTDAEIFTDSSTYLRIYILGVFFLFMYNGANAIFTALGDSRSPLMLLIFSSVVNIGLDLLFVLGFKMGVAGVAWATFIAQGVASMLAVFSVLKRIKKSNFEGEFKYFEGEMLKKISRIAIPSILQQSFISVGQLFVQSLANGFGPVTVAGYSAALKINTFAVMAMSMVSNGLSSFVAQNIGAKKVERISAGFKSAVIMAGSFSALVIILTFLFGEQLIGLFVDVNESSEVIRIGRNFLWVVVPFHLSVMLKITCDGALRGAGFMRGFMVSTFTDLLLRVVFSYATVSYLGFTAISWAYPFGWVISTVVAAYYYFSGKWKRVS